MSERVPGLGQERTHALTFKGASSIRIFSSHFKLILRKFKPTLYPLRYASSFVQLLYVFLCKIIRQTIKLLNSPCRIY